MARVLHIFGGLGTGGTERLIMNWYRHIDRSKVQFDFLVRSTEKHYEEEILAMGGRIFYTPSFPRHFRRNYIETKRILERKEWDVIHVHGNAAMYMLPLKLAKTLGYPCRIMHSHSVKAKKEAFSLVHKYNRTKMKRYTTHRLACSKAAGEWMFGDELFQVIPNAICMEDYRFDPQARQEIRKEYALKDRFVLGHVGRFASPKNHMFLLEVFKAVLSRKEGSVLLLVGEGELEKEIRAKAETLGISEAVRFVQGRSDIGALMSAMDLFVLPSLYEGLGIVLIEAQVSGLPCIVSKEAYHEEVEIFPTLSKLSLNEGAETWAEQIVQASGRLPQRRLEDSVLAATGYDMKTEIKYLEKLYLQEV